MRRVHGDGRGGPYTNTTVHYHINIPPPTCNILSNDISNLNLQSARRFFGGRSGSHDSRPRHRPARHVAHPLTENDVYQKKAAGCSGVTAGK